jgi:threonine dehydrogenase-like Zn-dependent dehydrogenase
MFWLLRLYGGYNGGQAEFVRVPYADFGPPHHSRSLTDDQALFLTDIFPPATRP